MTIKWNQYMVPCLLILLVVDYYRLYILDFGDSSLETKDMLVLKFGMLLFMLGAPTKPKLK